MAKNRAYFGIDWLISVILAIFPITNILLGILTRLDRKNYIGAILNFFLAFIFYFIDIITIVLSKDLTVLA